MFQTLSIQANQPSRYSLAPSPGATSDIRTLIECLDHRARIAPNSPALVCLEALREACRDLENARLRSSKAAHALATVREKLDQVVDLAYQQQSFAPSETLLSEEEAALAVYEKAVARLTEAEGRWCALSAALALEKELMLSGQFSRNQLH